MEQSAVGYMRQPIEFYEAPDRWKNSLAIFYGPEVSSWARMRHVGIFCGPDLIGYGAMEQLFNKTFKTDEVHLGAHQVHIKRPSRFGRA